jgi:tetratricopeptide (TPR) repeat protein
MGRKEASIAAARHAVIIDPLNRAAHASLGVTFFWGHDFSQAVTAFRNAIAMDADYAQSYALRGLAQYAMRDFQSAKASCEAKPDESLSQLCLAMTYDKLGRHADAESQLAKAKASDGDSSACEYAWVYAQWGNAPEALQWLETAQRIHLSDVMFLRVSPLLEPLRGEPRFQAIERELKFPD